MGRQRKKVGKGKNEKELDVFAKLEEEEKS